MNDECWLYRSRPLITVRRTDAIGDVISATVISDRLSQLGFEVNFQCSPGIAPILVHAPNIMNVLPVSGKPNINLDGAYEQNPKRCSLHVSEMYLQRAQSQFARANLGKALNCMPSLFVPKNNMSVREWESKLELYPKPWIFICSRSRSWLNRTVQDSTWGKVAENIPGTKFWINQGQPPNGVVNLGIRNPVELVPAIKCADIVLTVNSGPMHIAAALKIPMIVLGQSDSPELRLSDRRDFSVINSPGLECLNCQQPKCPISANNPPCQHFDPETIASAVRRRVTNQIGTISAIISIYKPDASVLNRCLECVLPQVNEIIICHDKSGVVPPSAIRHKKIKYVTCPQSDIGYGRKQNFAARHSVGEFLLLLNDDVFLDPEAVSRMQSVMNSQVGIVSNLLRYPDGTIYHAGKVRGNGVRGWGHIDHKKRVPTFTQPTQLEMCCGACVLVRRECFYDISGFDEDFYLYYEDEDFALRARQSGWSVWFTPYSTGIHLEHYSTGKTPGLQSLLDSGARIFNSKWGWYFDLNATTVPGRFS